MSDQKQPPLSNWLPAVAKYLPSLGFCVEYYYYDPNREKMMLKRIRLTNLAKRYHTKRERQLAAQRVADEVNARLRGGWSPLHESDDGRLYTLLPELRRRFLSAKRAEGCRETTLVQYGSVTDIFLRWCEDNGLMSRYSGTFLRPDAVRYMDDVLEQRLRHRSYNNTLKVLKAWWQWAVEHCYAKENAFVGIKTLKKEPKIRVLVDAESRAKVARYYAETRPAMLIVCQLVYSSAIRPAEILRIRLGDIHLKEHYIRIPAENAKNHHERYASLTPQLVELLRPVLEQRRDGSLYLIGKNAELSPDREPIGKSYFQKSWERMRRATGLPKEMQLYSLRDTGITDLLHAGVDPLTVQHHADHSSLEMQAIYTNHRDANLGAIIYEKGPSF